MCIRDSNNADLRYADFTGADLTGADLTGADLTGTDLRDANLRDADFTDANLSNAYFSKAKNVGAAVWSGATFSEDAILPSAIYDKAWFVSKGATFVPETISYALVFEESDSRLGQ